MALGASQIVPRMNVGLLISAAFLADFLLGIFAQQGWSTRMYHQILLPAIT